VWLCFTPTSVIACVGTRLSRRFHQSQVCLRAGAGDLHLLPYQAPTEDGSWSFELDAFLMRPRARGRVWLSSGEPTTRPAIDFRFLNDPDGTDVALLRDSAWPLPVELARTSPLSRLATLEPGSLEDTWGGSVTGYGHAVGTCRMGSAPDHEAVCDAGGAVGGMANVTVADASLIPTIPRANTQH
jgi:choline dehydrogenase